jgi:hypothetical protein
MEDSKIEERKNFMKRKLLKQTYTFSHYSCIPGPVEEERGVCCESPQEEDQ